MTIRKKAEGPHEMKYLFDKSLICQFKIKVETSWLNSLFL